MRVQPTDKLPCYLDPGEVRRVPRERRASVVGYHVCCPLCGFVTLVIQGANVRITEGPVPADLTLAVPVRCLYCQVLMHIQAGELRLEEDAHVRSIRYR